MISKAVVGTLLLAAAVLSLPVTPPPNDVAAGASGAGSTDASLQGQQVVDDFDEIGMTWKEPVQSEGYELPEEELQRPQSATMLLQYAVEGDDDFKPTLRETSPTYTDFESQVADIGGYVEPQDPVEAALEDIVQHPQSVNLIELEAKESPDPSPPYDKPSKTAAAATVSEQEPYPPPEPQPPYDEEAFPTAKGEKPATGNGESAVEEKAEKAPEEDKVASEVPAAPAATSASDDVTGANQEAHEEGVQSMATSEEGSLKDASTEEQVSETLDKAAVQMPEAASGNDAKGGDDHAMDVQEIEKMAKDGAISADNAASRITDMLVQTSSAANPLSSDEKKLLGEVMLTMVRMDTMNEDEKARASESLVDVMTQPKFEIPLEQVLEKLGAHPYAA